MLFILLIYVLIVIAYAIYSVLGIYHLWRFGYIGDLTKPVIIVYISISLLMILFSVAVILTRPWPIEFNLQ